MNVTMQMVADRARVSRMTVSRALRNDPALSPATRQRIHDLARQMGYRPNPLVSTLMVHLRSAKPVKFTATLGYVTTSSTRDGWRKSPGLNDYFIGAAERANELGYRLENYWLKEPRMTSKRMSEVLQTRGVHGLIIAPLPAVQGHLSLDWPRFASAAIGYSLVRPNLHRVTYNRIHAMGLVARQLKRRGYRRIALALPADADTRARHTWLSGFMASQLEVSSAFVPKTFGTSAFAKASVFVKTTTDKAADKSADKPALSDRGLGTLALLAERWTEENFARWFRQVKPDAVASADATVVKWLEKLGARVPDEVGFVLLDWSEQWSACTGIKRNAHLVGSAAVDLVVGQLHRNERGVPEFPKLVLVECGWVEGGTVRGKG